MITGGITAATVEVFFEAGVRVIIAGRSEEKGSKHAEKLGVHCIYQPADVKTEADIKALIALAVSHFGRLYCLFNNAGARCECTSEAVTPEDIKNAMDLLLGSVVFSMNHDAPEMKVHNAGCISSLGTPFMFLHLKRLISPIFHGLPFAHLFGLPR